MIATAIVLATICSGNGKLPIGLRSALEMELPLWAAITGNTLMDSDSQETIYVQREPDTFSLAYMVGRRLEIGVWREGDRYWVTDAKWCYGASWKDHTLDWWNRTPPEWDSPKSSDSPKGFELIHDSLVFGGGPSNDPIPAIAEGRRDWAKGACRNGFCFFASRKDSAVDRAVIRLDGSVAWWDGGYIKDIPNETEMIHAYDFLLRRGHSIPYKHAQVYPGQTVATWYDPSSKPVVATQAKPVAPKPSRFLLDSVGDLRTRAIGLKRQAGAKRLDGKKLEKIGDRFASRKAASRRAGDSLGCTEVNVRTLFRYADGSESLLAEKLPFALLLRDSSIALLGIHAGDSMAAVQAKLGRALGAGGDLLYYDSTHPYSDDPSDFLWEAMLVFQDGKLRSVVLVRTFDDC